MSRTVRNQLISILDTLENANAVLEQLLVKNDVKDTIDLLTECQNCAIEIGSQIEKVYGEGLETIHTLEVYCENLYLLTESFSNPDEIPARFEQICNQIQVVKSTLQKEIPDKKEIVFFPYQASMWDSLESVYLAAKEDEECETYCVPIPYFERNADGTLGEMRCEAADYPPNIEVTDWKAYDLETRRPDIVYIHNPYDEYNMVTCVHPDYFSTNIKKYTNRLVYIPYFVLDEIEPDDQKQIDGMKHFCFLPGIINADKVIVQSEKIRQIYMNEFQKAVETAGGTVMKGYLEEKFLGIGSPKFDKVLNTRKEDFIKEDILEGSFEKNNNNL